MHLSGESHYNMAEGSSGLQLLVVPCWVNPGQVHTGFPRTNVKELGDDSAEMQTIVPCQAGWCFWPCAGSPKQMSICSKVLK